MADAAPVDTSTQQLVGVLVGLLGGLGAGHGAWFTQSELQIVVGALFAIAGVGYTWYQRQKAKPPA